MSSETTPATVATPSDSGELGAPYESRELDQMFLLHSAALQSGEAVARWWFRWRADVQDASSETKLHEVLRDSLHGIARALSADAVAILLADREGNLVVRAALGLQSELFREVHIAVGAGMAGRVVAERRPYVVKDLSTIEVASETLRDSGVQSLVAVPIFGGDRVVGVLHADSYRLGYFDERHAALLSVVADRLGAAIEQVRLFEAEREARAQAELLAGRLARLQRVTAVLSRELDVDEIAQVVLSELSQDIAAEGSTQLIWVVEGDRLRLVAPGGARPETRLFADMALDERLPGPAVVKSGEPLWFGSRRELEEFGELRKAQLTGEALAVLPLVVEDRAIGVLAVSYPRPRAFADGEKLYLSVAARQVAEALHRAALRHSRVRDNLANALLSDVSAALGASLDLPTSLRGALGEIVPRLADLAVVHLLDDLGVPRRVALVHRDPESEAVLVQAPEEPGLEAHPLLVALATGQGRPILLPQSNELVDEVAINETHARRLAQLQITSAVAAPLWARGEQLGVLALMRLGVSPPYQREDLELAAEIGARASNAIDNALQHERRVAVARALQASLLPPALAEVPGAEVSAFFHPASAGIDVGGDFYDLFPVDGKRWVLMIGDVSGSGPAAAALTAQVRHGARVAARAGLEPAAVVAAVNTTLDETTGSEWFCTMVYAELTPHDDGIDLQVICAGHVPPLVVAGGHVEELDGQAPLLGVMPGARFPPRRLRLAPGHALVMVTDGATEARSTDRMSADPFFGEERLCRAVADAAGRHAHGLVQAVADAVFAYSGRQLDDDLAVVALRAVPAPSVQNRAQ